MKNQNNQKSAEHEKAIGNGNNFSPLAEPKKLFDTTGKDLFPQQFKPGNSEERILIDIVGKLTIPVNALNTTRPRTMQN
jgi:hypothetical protein